MQLERYSITGLKKAITHRRKRVKKFAEEAELLERLIEVLERIQGELEPQHRKVIARVLDHVRSQHAMKKFALEKALAELQRFCEELERRRMPA